MFAFHRSALIVGVFWLALFVPRVFAQQSKTAEALAAAVDQHYNHLHSLTATFAESYRGAGIERSESGTVELQRSGKMRWDYRAPTEKVFVTDGKNAWFYVPGERQARKQSVKAIDDLRSPLRFLLGKTRISRELEQLTLEERNGTQVLRGIPVTMRDRIDQIALTINANDQIVGIRIDEADGSQTEFRFSDLAENVAAPESAFSFTPPPGVEVVSQ